MPKNTPSGIKTKTIRPDHFEQARRNNHVLYRCFNRRNLLLYVGMTNHPEERFRQHQNTKPWWKYVDHITLQWFPNRRILSTAEAIAIESENPQFNIVVPQPPAPMVARSRAGVGILWPQAHDFGTIVPEHGFIIAQTLEQQLYPCVECHAHAIYCEGDIVACKLCTTEWTFDDWFKMTFRTEPDTPVGSQMTLL